MSAKRRVSWREFEGLAEKVVAQIRASGVRAGEGGAILLAVGRGGFPLATVLSHRLGDLRVVPVMARSFDGEKRRGEVVIESEGAWLSMLRADEPIIIVDDIADEGATLSALLRLLKDRASPVTQPKIATLFHREDAQVTPDFTGEKLPKDAPWIAFPWESLPEG